MRNEYEINCNNVLNSCTVGYSTQSNEEHVPIRYNCKVGFNEIIIELIDAAHECRIVQTERKIIQGQLIVSHSIVGKSIIATRTFEKIQS